MSSLHDALQRYLAVRRALGTQLREPGGTLSQFVTFLEAEGAHFITTGLALRWARQPSGVQRATWARRLTMVRRFAAWWSAFDARTEVPPKRILGSIRRRRTPYIFTDQEIGRILAEAARLSSPSGLRAHSFTTLIGLLASTGLRPGEALGLTVSDMDLSNGILTIRETKFGKSRLVPLDESTRLALERYSARRDRTRQGSMTEAFFLSEPGTRLQPYTARRTFASMSCAIGLRSEDGRGRYGRGPRLQDFRHTFATRRLVEWYRAGVDVARELPKLATYLGHDDVAFTYWYIEAVPELLQLATERLSEQPEFQP